MKTILSGFAAVALAGFVAAVCVASRPHRAPSTTPRADVALFLHNDESRFWEKGPRACSCRRGRKENTPTHINAMGTVKPEELVEVDAQVNGMIESFGPDPSDPSKPIDYGSLVHKGDVLAQIDPTIYVAQVDYAKASLSRSEADLQQLQARCDAAKNDWLRAQSLLPPKAISNTDYDAAVSNYRAAMANVSVGRSSVQQCEAQFASPQPIWVIRSSSRQSTGWSSTAGVNIGQTVIAAFNAPGLFLVAKDLRRVQVWANVTGDIGRIRPGQTTQFTVEAYPSETFEGRVSQIRLNPTKIGDRTAYTVVVAAQNAHGMLPYLTAKLRFPIGDGSVAGTLAQNPLPCPKPLPNIPLRRASGSLPVRAVGEVKASCGVERGRAAETADVRQKGSAEDRFGLMPFGSGVVKLEPSRC